MKDNFSNQSDKYALYRPGYPKELFEYISGLVKEKNLAWDCGTGNGQSARELSAYFNKVYATDISGKQLQHAPLLNNIEYAVEAAEKTALPDNSVDLITVSQALHWFDFSLFYNEVRRVGKKESRIVIWSYGLLTVDPAIDPIIQHYHFKILKNYWDKERQYVNDAYKNILFPFKIIPSPVFKIEVKWTKEMLKGFLNTWSATQKYIAANKVNRVDELILQIARYWVDDETRRVNFPLFLKAGRVH